MTRPFDKHLDSHELEGLVSSPGTSVSDLGQLSEQSVGEARRHVESCQECSQKLRMHRFVQSEILRMRAPNPSSPTPECMGDAEWLEVAAGLLPEARTIALMKHAAQCGQCGPLLRNAAQALVDEPSTGEEAWLASLPSARPEWRKKMAETLRDSAGAWGDNGDRDRSREKKEGAPWRQALFSWSRLAFALAGLAAAVMAGWLGVSLLHSSSAEELLAQAYTEHRTLEVRIPGAKYAPMRVERAASGSSLDKSPSLLKAEALIGENLRKSPNDPAWLQAKARADLLDGNYESAINSLRRALETQPDDPHLLTDLGAAYFVRAESTDHAIDYGNAIESLSKALGKSPDDPITLFNRALSCERMFLYTQAADDWEHYLRVDPHGEWAENARANLLRVKQKLAEREKRTAAPLLSPSEFSAAIDANRDQAIAMLDQRAERYLETATQSWLPLAYGNGDGAQATPVEARRALEYLAEILKSRHDDPWLADFLQSPADPSEREALRALFASDEALHSGRYGLSVELAQKSMRGFHHARNQAGKLRASFALMLGQTFAFESADCLKTFAAAIPVLSATRYRWLQSQSLIQEGQCQGGSAQEEDAIRSTSEGAEIARISHYPGLELRAAAFAGVYRSHLSSADRGLRDLINGLATFWNSDITNARGENLYSVLFQVAGILNWHQVEVDAIAEKMGDFPVRDPVDQAIGWELLAGAQVRTEDYKAALTNLQHATERLETLPEDNGIALRKAEISLENAEIQRNLGDPNGAIATLAKLRPTFEVTPPLFQAAYFKTYGEAQLDLENDSAAEPLLLRALSLTESGLNGLRLEADKLEWSRTQEGIYRDLFGLKLRSGAPAEAFAWWEWYKGASVRERNSTNPSTITENILRPFLRPETFSLPSGTVVISYAVLKRSTTVFVFRDGRVKSRSLRLPGEAQLGALRFLSLCADPSADMASLNAESRRLYEILVAPLETDIRDATALRFETDGILDQIPFDLLKGPDGRYLTDRFEVTYSPGLAYAAKSRPAAISADSGALIVVASGAQDPGLTPLPDATDEGNDVVSYFHNANLVSGSQLTRSEVLHNLRMAQVFHFVGHALVDVDEVGLIIGPDVVVNSRDMAKARFRDLRLVVLSACDTAGGVDGRFADLTSLARILAAAGVSQIVASRWNVDSAATRELMRAFYSNLMSGKTPAAALHSATIAVRSLPRYRSPYYWGSFTVFGS